MIVVFLFVLRGSTHREKSRIFVLEVSRMANTVKEKCCSSQPQKPSKRIIENETISISVCKHYCLTISLSRFIVWHLILHVSFSLLADQCIL